MGFYRDGSSSKFRVWDADTAGGWVDVAVPAGSAQWYDLQISGTATGYQYWLNGLSVYTDMTATNPNQLTDVMVQARNFDGPTYDVHWDNIGARDGTVPEPGSALLAGIALGGLTLRRRRK